MIDTRRDVTADPGSDFDVFGVLPLSDVCVGVVNINARAERMFLQVVFRLSASFAIDCGNVTSLCLEGALIPVNRSHNANVNVPVRSVRRRHVYLCVVWVGGH